MEKGWIWVAKSVIWEAWRLHFGTLEGHFDELGACRDLLDDHLGSRVRFSRFLDDLGVLLGSIWSSLW